MTTVRVVYEGENTYNEKRYTDITAAEALKGFNGEHTLERMDVDPPNVTTDDDGVKHVTHPPIGVKHLRAHSQGEHKPVSGKLEAGTYLLVPAKELAPA